MRVCGERSSSSGVVGLLGAAIEREGREEKTNSFNVQYDACVVGGYATIIMMTPKIVHLEMSPKNCCCVFSSPTSNNFLDSSLAVHKPSPFLPASSLPRENPLTRDFTIFGVIIIILHHLLQSTRYLLTRTSLGADFVFHQTSPQSTDVCTDTERSFYSSRTSPW